jgi:hypothetical protein
MPVLHHHTSLCRRLPTILSQLSFHHRLYGERPILYQWQKKSVIRPGSDSYPFTSRSKIIYSFAASLVPLSSK